MSGGSMDYFSYKVEDAVSRIKQITPLHRAFKAHLLLVASALHEIEWVESGDCGEGDDVAAIKAALGTPVKAAQIKILREDLKRLIEEAKELLSE